MTSLATLVNSPAVKEDEKSDYEFRNSVGDCLYGMVDFTMPSLLLNPDFNFLSAQGTNPTTPANGDNFEFIQKWFIVGALNADYVITPTLYANTAIQNTSSLYYIDHKVVAYSGGDFYYYQRQLNTLRKYQKRYLTYSLYIFNTLDTVVGVSFDIYTFFDPGSRLNKGATIYLQPGANDLSSTILMPEIGVPVVGDNAYTEFRLNFSDIPGGSARLFISWLKCEIGSIATPLNTDHALEAARLSFA